MPATTPSRIRRLRASVGGAKRSEFRMAIGRAPMVKMSRRIPPTPVAAPWYGSMKDGWLWDSILNTAASPPPMSTAPAFSPGPWRTRGPSVGSVFRWMRLLLYEQCSDHITENRPSSVRLGSRPRAATMRSYSSGRRLCRARISGVAIIGASYILSAADDLAQRTRARVQRRAPRRRLARPPPHPRRLAPPERRAGDRGRRLLPRRDQGGARPVREGSRRGAGIEVLLDLPAPRDEPGQGRRRAHRPRARHERDHGHPRRGSRVPPP